MDTVRGFVCTPFPHFEGYEDILAHPNTWHHSLQTDDGAKPALWTELETLLRDTTDETA